MLVVTGNGRFCEECKASDSARRSLHCGKRPLFKTALRLKRKKGRQGGQETECGFQDVLQSQLHVAVIFQARTLIDKGVEKRFVIDIGFRPQSGLQMGHR